VGVRGRGEAGCDGAPPRHGSPFPFCAPPEGEKRPAGAVWCEGVERIDGWLWLWTRRADMWAHSTLVSRAPGCGWAWSTSARAPSSRKQNPKPRIGSPQAYPLQPLSLHLRAGSRRRHWRRRRWSWCPPPAPSCTRATVRPRLLSPPYTTLVLAHFLIFSRFLQDWSLRPGRHTQLLRATGRGD
jgi:hypothetical protein